MGDVLWTRRKQSEDGLSDMRDALRDFQARFEENCVALYVTGSFGRLEARYQRQPPLETPTWQGSDLDVFFMYMPEERDPRLKLSRLAWFELIAPVIEAARRLNFKPFSRDGAFLSPHNVFHIGNELGSQHEDSENGFTARLLLLLEGRYLANEPLFDAVLLEAISFYYRDYADNRDGFRPYALINDILRYWRTLCLNYEHQRRTAYDVAKDDPARLVAFKAESALSNLKLRYSRLAICFSMIAFLVSEPPGIPPERVREMSRITPSKRWEKAAERHDEGAAQETVHRIVSSYEGFLALVGDHESLLARLADQNERRELRSRAGEFGDLVFDLIKLVAAPEEFRRLVV